MGLVARRGHALKKQHPQSRSDWPTPSRQVPYEFPIFCLELCQVIFSSPAGSPRLAFTTHSRSMLDCLDRPTQLPSPLPPLPPRRPREADSSVASEYQLLLPCPGRQAPPMVLRVQWQIQDHLYRENPVMPSESLQPALLSRVTKCTPK